MLSGVIVHQGGGGRNFKRLNKLPPSVLGRFRRGKRAPVVGVWLVWVGLVWRFFSGSLVAVADAAVSLVLEVLVMARHDYI